MKADETKTDDELESELLDLLKAGRITEQEFNDRMAELRRERRRERWDCDWIFGPWS